MIDKKWAKTLALALSFPTMIIVLIIIITKLIESKVLTPSLGYTIFFIIIISVIITLVRYAYQNKD